MEASFNEIVIKTQGCFEFTDITEQVLAHVENSGIRYGVVNVQTRHTTTAIVVNENEPGLLQDMQHVLERCAPQSAYYRHNECPPDEPGTVHDNGHSHCRAMLLKASESLNIVHGKVQLGQWQRMFLLELDRPRERKVSLLAFGVATPSASIFEMAAAEARS
jgi:secondary thiamine-phosphate synthase enzyme